MGFLDRLASSPYMPSARTWLLTALGALLLFSLMMVLSSSIPFAIASNLSDLKFFVAHLTYIGVAVMVGCVAYCLPLKLYYRMDALIAVFFVMIGLLLATLLIAEPVNGSRRWLQVGSLNFQTAELAKVFFVLVIADYMTRRSADVRTNMISATWVLLVWYLPVLLLLYFQPDFGSIVVIVATTVVLFFIGGAPKRQYIPILIAVVTIGALVLLNADYRHSRVFSFMNPYDDVMGTDYQLSRSLGAYARGEWVGVGYGNSIQKLNHLPEAHTDFVLAIVGEEFGFFGVSVVIILLLIVIAAIMRISYKSLVRRQLKLSYTAFGFGVVIFGQVIINAGMTMGILPTKGLTLPFFSYGGSAMLFAMIMIAIVLKIDKDSPKISQRGESREY
ncbi:MAG: putative peptidoglycan glycosyltransferase FtsW [Moraxella sp.]|nr:putative peptidoglycan glycosyltransferase FtsW [Moraxella sp.]